jgi:hypothetical protein
MTKRIDLSRIFSYDLISEKSSAWEHIVVWRLAVLMVVGLSGTSIGIRPLAEFSNKTHKNRFPAVFEF